MAEVVSTLIPNETVMKNLKEAAFKRSVSEIKGKVLSMATHNHVIALGTLNEGCQIYR